MLRARALIKRLCIHLELRYRVPFVCLMHTGVKGDKDVYAWFRASSYQAYDTKVRYEGLRKPLRVHLTEHRT